MKKQTVLSCALTAALFGVFASSTAMAANKFERGAIPRAAVGGMGDNQSFNRFIVTYRDGTTAKKSSAEAVKSFNTALSRSGVSKAKANAQPLTATHVRKLAIGADLIRVSGKLDRVQAAALMQQIASDPNVKSVYPDRLRQAERDVQAEAKVQPTFVPNDPMFQEYQWHSRAPDGGATYDGGPNYGGANVPAGWDLADGTGIVIAVLDTGITAHPDVDTSLAAAGYDFITDAFVSGRETDGRVAGGWDTGDWTNTAPWNTDPSCTQIRASNWHGTHVASTAGAELTNNGAGMTGVAYGAKILPVRVLGHCGGYDSDISDAIIWAAGGTVEGVPANANPAQVINMSLGGSGACTENDPYYAAIAEANELGATVVVSAGNSGADAANYSPASCPGVVTVAANGVTSKRATYSNYGTSVEISAPGGGIYANDGDGGTQIYDGFVWQAKNSGTTTPVPSDQIDPALAYGGFAGTSQAAPHVSGVVALMQGARLDADLPLLTPTEVLGILQSSASPFAVAPSAGKPIGAGIVNAGAAVAAAIEPPCTEDCGPVATPLTNKVAVTGLSGAAGSETLYSFEATAGSVLSVLTYGGTGNVSVYVSFGAEPTTAAFDAKSTRAGNSETVRFTAAQAGTYYIKLVGAGTYGGVTLVARQ